MSVSDGANVRRPRTENRTADRHEELIQVTSHYDPKKNCRVGTMDEKQFYEESGDVNGAYFRKLIQAWDRSGGALKWGAGGVGLRGEVGGQEVGVCFLAPAYAKKRDRIELSCAPLKKQIGAIRCTKFVETIRTVAGEHVLGASMISIVEPGKLSTSQQHALTRALCALI